VDINIFNLNSLRRGLELNGLDKNPIFKIWLSDALKHVPAGQSFDLIVSNPPHFFTEKFTDNKALSASRLGTYDQDWKFHREFYMECHHYLVPGGEVWFLENGQAAREADLLPFIKANPALTYLETLAEPTVPDFFWMMSRRAI
jgi:16S rRNA G1207 methylase RsmC